MNTRATPRTPSPPAPASEKTSQDTAHPVRNINVTRKMKGSVRAAKALKLRIKGYPWDEIATILGYANKSGPHNAAKKWMYRTVKEPADHLRRLEDERLNVLWRKAMEILDSIHPMLHQGKIVSDPKTKKRLQNSAPILAAIERLISIMDRRAKLHGLDMPSKMALTDPTGEKPYDPLHVYMPDNSRDSIPGEPPL